MNSTHKAITTLENAGKYLCKSRNLQDAVVHYNASQASKSENPEIQVFAILAVLLARVVGSNDDGWVSSICSTLNIPEVK